MPDVVEADLGQPGRGDVRCERCSPGPFSDSPVLAPQDVAAASAPVVAAAFHPSLAPVGVLLGTLGYATGTVIAYGLGQLLRVMAGA